MKSRYLCDIPCIFCSNMGWEKLKTVSASAMYNWEYNFNVFHIAKRLQSEWKLSENNRNIMLTKCNNKIKFDIVISMPCEAIYACYNYQGNKLGVITAESGTKMSSHELLRHCKKEATIKIAKYLGWRIKHSSMSHCESCVNAKMRQKM